MSDLQRRTFLQVLGGGIVVLIAYRDVEALAHLAGYDFQQRGYPTDFNAYLRIGEDGRVTVYSGKIEMGQGVTTSLAQMAAEELGVDVDSIQMVMGDTATCPWDAGTWGSLTTRVFGPALRAAAAEAKQVLLQLGAEQLQVPVERVRVRHGAVETIAQPARRVTYAQLAQGRRIERTVSTKAVLTAAQDFTVMGKSLRRVEAVAKVTGQAKYAGDIRLDGMLYARLLRPPAHGAVLQRADTTAAKRVPGILVVERDGLVAVLHADPEQAEKALALVTAEWTPSPTAATLDPNTIHAHLLERAPRQGTVQREQGDVAAAATGTAQIFDHTYTDGYVAHAPMETHTALARVEADRATLWISTQSPFGDQQRVAQALGLPVANVQVITPWVGGGFGGKASSGQAIEAARLAQITARPVQVMWSRAEEFFYDTFRAAAVMKVQSALDAAGKLSLWDYRVYAAGARGSELFYDAPNLRIAAHGPSWTLPAGAHPFATGPWRAPGASSNTFARESQLDIMAAAARLDPIEFRLRNTSEPRVRAVITAAAERFGWQAAPAPSKRGVGVAVGYDAGTYVAVIAHIQLDRDTGRIQVRHVVAAQDMGVIVNPEGAIMQMEGCITMGLGYTLSEQLRFRGGEVLDRGFGTYRLPRFSWVPRIDTVLVRNDQVPPQGGGEPAIVCMGAAVANALFDLTGARLFALPLLPERVQAALTAL